MSRELYAAGPGDVVAVVSTDDGDYAPADVSTVFDVYDAFTGGTAQTDLTAADGTTATTTVSPDASGRILFYGPDDFTGALWLQDQANPSNARYLVNPSDLADRTVAAGSVEVADITDVTSSEVESFLTADDAGDARSAIGAGTSSLTLGTSGSTAAAGNDARLFDARTPTDDSVTTAKLADGAVTEDKLADQAATLDKIGDGIKGPNAVTFGLRKLGTAATEAAAGDHTHNLEDLAGDVSDLSGTITAAQLVSGAIMLVASSSGSWANRPTARTDVTVLWLSTATDDDTPPGAISGVDVWLKLLA